MTVFKNENSTTDSPTSISTDQIFNIPNTIKLAKLSTAGWLAANLSGCNKGDAKNKSSADSTSLNSKTKYDNLKQWREDEDIFDPASGDSFPSYDSLPLPSKQEAAKFLQRAGLSSTVKEISTLQRLGYKGWLNNQVAKPHNSAWQWLVDKDYLNIGYNKFQEEPLHNVLWHQLFKSEDVLRKRVALSLSQIFVVSVKALNIHYRSYATAAYWDLLNEYAFGNFRDLIEAVTLSPAMGAYLSTVGNKKANPSTGSAPDENYAREIMQLFTIGLYELNIDGSYKLDANRQPIETYTQNDIINLARVFTGWNYDSSQDLGIKPPQSARISLVLNENLHSTEAVNFLNTHIPADTDGYTALKVALDTLFNHPNVAPFISKQLIQRLVTSNPSSGYIARVAKVFNSNQQGVRGDLKSVIEAILLDKEALKKRSLNDKSWGKIKEPMLRFIQWGRSFNVESYSGRFRISSMSDVSIYLAQSPMESPSVFNYYRPGYVPPNTILGDRGLLAPELQITNVITSSSYINFIFRIIEEGVGDWLSSYSRNDVYADYSSKIAIADNVPKLINQLNLELTAGQLSTDTVAEIVQAIETINSTTRRVKAAIGIIMSTPEYIVLK